MTARSEISLLHTALQDFNEPGDRSYSLRPEREEGGCKSDSNAGLGFGHLKNTSVS